MADIKTLCSDLKRPSNRAGQVNKSSELEKIGSVFHQNNRMQTQVAQTMKTPSNLIINPNVLQMAHSTLIDSIQESPTNDGGVRNSLVQMQHELHHFLHRHEKS